MTQWFVVETRSQAERQAQAHLDRQGFRTYLPRYLKRRRHARTTDHVPAPLFPRYLFVEMDPGTQRWRAINSTVGVTRLLSFGAQPTAVPKGIIEAIRKREDPEGYVHMAGGSGFGAGQSVRILEGPLADHEGLFQCTDDNQRVIVLLDILGRAVKVRVPKDGIAAAS